MTRVEKLLEISSDPLGKRPEGPSTLLDPYKLGPELLNMLQGRNGFYTFESSLHVFPLTSSNAMGLEEWNALSLWRNSYQDLAEGLLFFAEDAFQDQFCLSADAVLRFRAETGERVFLADSIENWAAVLLENYQQESGWPLASKWQAEHGPLQPGRRLMPKIPFLLGGEYSIDNLWAGDSVEGMRFKADIAIQTRDLPDGSTVRLQVGKKPFTQ